MSAPDPNVATWSEIVSLDQQLIALQVKFDSLQYTALDLKSRYDTLLRAVRRAVEDLALARSAEDTDKIMGHLEDALDDIGEGRG